MFWQTLVEKMCLTEKRKIEKYRGLALGSSAFEIEIHTVVGLADGDPKNLRAAAACHKTVRSMYRVLFTLADYDGEAAEVNTADGANSDSSIFRQTSYAVPAMS